MDFEKARFNMVEQQVRPWDVLDQGVLDLLSQVKRELFVPAEHRGLAFSDTDIALTQRPTSFGEVLFSPKLDARILQELRVKRSDSVLEVGCGSGYMAALLAKQAKHVTSLEINALLAQKAVSNLHEAGFQSVEVVEADASKWIHSNQQTWDVIVFSGSIGKLDELWLNRLNAGGRLAAYVGVAPVMQARIYQRGQDKADGPALEKILFETNVARLHNFPEHSKFVF
jgi:protein-L-isoaspartate(D-aspartate) O-methyltransferase